MNFFELFAFPATKEKPDIFLRAHLAPEKTGHSAAAARREGDGSGSRTLSLQHERPTWLNGMWRAVVCPADVL